MTLEKAPQLVTSPLYWPCSRKWTRKPSVFKSMGSAWAPWCRRHSSRLQQKQLLCPDSGSHSITDESHPQTVCFSPL